MKRKEGIVCALAKVIAFSCALLAHSPATAQSPSAVGPWLMEQSQSFSGLRKRPPVSVQRDLEWTESSAEIPILLNVAWVKSDGEVLFIVNISADLPTMRVFTERGELTGVLGFYHGTKYCVAESKSNGVLQISGEGLQLGVVSDEARDSHTGLVPLTGANTDSESFRLIELRRGGLKVQYDVNALRRTRAAIKRGCRSPITWAMEE